LSCFDVQRAISFSFFSRKLLIPWRCLDPLSDIPLETKTLMSPLADPPNGLGYVTLLPFLPRFEFRLNSLFCGAHEAYSYPTSLFLPGHVTAFFYFALFRFLCFNLSLFIPVASHFLFSWGMRWRLVSSLFSSLCLGLRDEGGLQTSSRRGVRDCF